MLIVACVENRDYLGMGAEYTRRLRSMVARRITVPWRFACLTDDPDRHVIPGDEVQFTPVLDKVSQLLTGWWAKLYLFQPGRFPKGARIVYLDLDTVVVGDVYELARHKGACNARDWGWDRDVALGGALVWDEGEHPDIWTGAETAPKRFKDDQDYLNAVGGWPFLPPHLVRSYRYESTTAPAAGAVAIAFHGKPKPHEITEGWVKEAWW